ncbi:MAG: ABC transporter permease [Armatimonadota bacterium]
MKLSLYILRRLVLLIPVFLGISVITFTLSRVVPGDPARLAAGLEAREEQVERIRSEFGLDQPLSVQYARYARRLLRGDLGQSIFNQQPVRDNLRRFFPATFELAAAALVLALLLGIPLGVVSAVHKDRSVDQFSRVVALLGIAFPVFWVGIVLLLVFYFRLGWFPGGGRVDAPIFLQQPVPSLTGLLTIDALITGNWSVWRNALWHLALPAFCMSLSPLARVTRMTRTTMAEVLHEMYVTTARAKGLHERRVVYKHALRNALIPTVTLVGIASGYLLGGSVLVETIFSWPGLGRYAFDSITLLDFQAIMGITLLATVVFVITNLIVDVLYVLLDPRIRYG